MKLKDNGHKSMLWMMVVCCLLPVVVLFGGVAFFELMGYIWTGIGFLGIFLMIYFIKIRRAKYHRNSNSSDLENHQSQNGHNGCFC